MVLTHPFTSDPAAGAIQLPSIRTCISSMWVLQWSHPQGAQEPLPWSNMESIPMGIFHCHPPGLRSEGLTGSSSGPVVEFVPLLNTVFMELFHGQQSTMITRQTVRLQTLIDPIEFALANEVGDLRSSGLNSGKPCNATVKQSNRMTSLTAVCFLNRSNT